MRFVVYPALVALALYAGYATYVAWPRAAPSLLSIQDISNHAKLVQMRAQALVSPTPRTFVAPTLFHYPKLPNDIVALRRLAETGNADAECELGYKYVYGTGVSKDYREARRWFIEGASKHNGCAINGLAGSYENGWGVAVDPALAISYYKAAASLGYPAAYGNLGRAYERGFGVQPDDAVAFQWYLKAANAGEEPCYDAVAGYYYSGRAGSVDRFLAERWFELAARTGDAFAVESLASVYINDDKLAGHYGLALEWLQKDERSPWSQYVLGWLYQHGNGVEKSSIEAVHWYRLASEKRYGPAEAAYAAILHSGASGISRDDTEAATYYTAAARDGNALGMYELATMTQAGVGTSKNDVLAERLFSAAASLGNPDALIAVASRYKYGTHGYPRDEARAEALAMVAFSFGAGSAQVVAIAPARSAVDGQQVLELSNTFQNEIDLRAARLGIDPGSPAIPSVPNPNR
ncbi:MAG TPA: tetratricopeptide repeat protein [Candidatus Eremiobacteraceae bacterium]|nr:tetratricopeptide repeat protein [Candidatus Eremiobacteraceae bacterium]